MMREGEQRLAFTVPIFEPLPSQYYIRVVSDQAGAAAPFVAPFVALVAPLVWDALHRCCSRISAAALQERAGAGRPSQAAPRPALPAS